jgi:predicted transcriptional regulator
VAGTDKQRSTIRIYLDILLAAQSEGNAKPTRILQRANLPHDRMMRHVSELQKRGLLDEVSNGDSRYYVITARGQSFIKEALKAEQFLSAFGVSL